MWVGVWLTHGVPVGLSSRGVVALLVVANFSGGLAGALGTLALNAYPYKGRLVLYATAGYGVACFLFGCSPLLMSGVLTIFLCSIFVEFFQKVFVLLFCSSCVALIFHLKHDRDEFKTTLIRISEDVIAFTSRTGVIVFLKVGVCEGGSAQLIEFDFTMLLKRLTPLVPSRNSCFAPL